MPDESELLCGGWAFDASLREMRHYPRHKKGYADTPDAVEHLEPATSVTLYQWSQQPMMSSTGDRPPSASQARVEVVYTDGRKLTINEDDRACARKIGETIAASYNMPLLERGAPTGVRGGNLPQRDEMGRLRYSDGRTEAILDDSMGELRVKRSKRLFRSEKAAFRTADIRRLELAREVSGPTETFVVYAIAGPEEERIPVAGYSGYEGWADPEEWRQFVKDLAQMLHVDWSETGQTGS
ncbi:MAG: hypothetical protein AAB092_06770 [Chloroflexota bacterium]